MCFRLEVTVLVLCVMTVSFYQLLLCRNVAFLKKPQQSHGHHMVLCYFVRHSGMNELHELLDIL